MQCHLLLLHVIIHDNLDALVGTQRFLVGALACTWMLWATACVLVLLCIPCYLSLACKVVMVC